jgi:amino acid transporter
MISSGIFILPGLAFSYAGPAVFISYFLAGVLALVGVLSVIELSTAMPKAGGDYYFVTRSLGPLVGTVSGIMSWFALSLKTAFAVFGIAEIVFLLTGTPVLLTAAVVKAGGLLGHRGTGHPWDVLFRGDAPGQGGAFSPLYPRRNQFGFVNGWVCLRVVWGPAECGDDF